MKTLLYTMFIVACCALVNCGPASTPNRNNNMDGWHFHVCSNETKATRIWLELSGTTKKEKYESRELKWTSGKGSFVSVPEDMRFIDDLNLSIRTSGNRKAKVCVLYGDYVIDSIEVSGTEHQKLNKQHRDECPC